MNSTGNRSVCRDMFMALANSSSRTHTPGRRANTDENAKILADLASSDTKFEFRATQKDPEAVLRVREGATLANLDKAEFARQAVKAAVDRLKANQPISGEIDWANIGTDSFRAPFLSSVPCGPWQDAVSEGTSFTVSKDVADLIEARDGDVWVEASGDSMIGAGIQDGFMVLARPLPEGRTPRRGEIAIIQAFAGEEEEAVLGTIKRWMPPKGGEVLPTLLNGDDEEFDLPDNVQRVVPVAVGRAVIGRI